jgi:hypothetical protein
MQHLEVPISENEIKTVILNAPKGKSPGLDGFIGLFFSSCWDIVKGGIISAINQFYNMNQ